MSFLHVAYAATQAITLPNPLGCRDLGCVVDKIIDGIYYLSIPVVSIMVLIGGFQILVASGDPEKLKTGKNTILYAALGFAVILLAKSVVLIVRSIFPEDGGAASELIDHVSRLFV